MKVVNFFCYTKYSKSVKNIKQELSQHQVVANRFQHYDSSNPHLTPNKILLVNWGCKGNVPNVLKAWSVPFLNKNVTNFVNKRNFFKAFSEFTPPALFDWEDMEDHIIEHPGERWFARTSLNSHSGHGIIEFSNIHQFHDSVNDPCHLFTKYIKKRSEYRCHFFKKRNGFFDFHWQQKRKVLNHPTPVNFSIRSHSNGWVFCRENIQVPEAVVSIVNDFVHNENNTLDFGAIDIIYNEAQNRAYILEVNLSPGTEGTTSAVYADYFNSYIQQHYGLV